MHCIPNKMRLWKSFYNTFTQSLNKSCNNFCQFRFKPQRSSTYKMQNSFCLLLNGYLLLCCLGEVWLKKIQPLVLVHGGAGEVADGSVPAKHEGTKLAARVGYDTLRKTDSVLDAVEVAVSSLEIDPNFNAGYGSVLTWDGKVEMDAAIMHGATLDAGCVSLARNIIHPIVLARRIMEQTRHKYLAGEGAMDFAVKSGFELLPEGALVTAKSLQALEGYKQSCKSNSLEHLVVNTFFSEYDQSGTVGAVAIDEYGNVAAATSTGGITGKLSGRIGDSPILGGGTYADNAAGAVSATGHGETIMRYNVASRILGLIERSGMTAQEATKKVLNDMTERFNQTAGVISIDSNGTVGIYHTSPRMAWAYQRGDELHYGIDNAEDRVEVLSNIEMNLDKN